ncbi:MAG: hypothetical protein ACOYYS_19820 [Chloroflexota bacterium]
MSFTPEQIAFAQTLLVRFGWLLLVILLDLALGITVALKQKVFQWDKVADFLGDYGPKLIAWLALELLSLLPTELKLIAGIVDFSGNGAYALILLSAAASVLGHAQAIGVLPVEVPGVPATDKRAAL